MFKYIIFVLFSYLYYINCCQTSTKTHYFPPDGARAIAIMKGDYGANSISGYVMFEQKTIDDLVKINVNITGLPVSLKTKHGLHVHSNGITVASGNTTTICGSTGAHYNPLNKTHGDISASERHVGDYGNVNMDANGNIIAEFYDNISQLYGSYPIIGRTIVLHELEDDLGLKNDTGSKTTGNAGARIACGIIGIAP